MITTSREADFSIKQEGNTVDGKKWSTGCSSLTPWSRLKDPRIVRVSRAFGGKDRHSKVCTVKGLRDRRVRLSVPTAIQLYELQDRLGLNQPSKVVDWLLNAAKHEIDELPPLQMPPPNFGQNYHQPLMPSNNIHGVLDANSQSNKQELKNTYNSVDWSNFWNSNANLRDKSRVVEKETADDAKENWNRRNEEERQIILESHGANVSPHNDLFPRPNHSSIPGGLLNNAAAMPYSSLLYRWDPSSNISLSHIGSHGFTTQTEDCGLHNFNVVPIPSTLSLQPTGTSQPYFPSQTVDYFDPKQINHFQCR